MKEPPVKTDPALNRGHFKSALDRSRAKHFLLCTFVLIGFFSAFCVWCGQLILARFSWLDRRNREESAHGARVRAVLGQCILHISDIRPQPPLPPTQCWRENFFEKNFFVFFEKKIAKTNSEKITTTAHTPKKLQH